ncbi:MAG: U32 family peptidase [Firmicutes bacterium]|nr:U32 family peptidase [Bacillota bacterium]
MKQIPELLAPVGGPAQLYAAVNNGADAVYLGGSRFNARAKADNFPLPKLRDAIAYAHERNVKVYVTFNTLLKDRELADALDYAAALWEIGADAVIVQDMGLVRILGQYLPGLPLHLSTQATVYNPQAVDLMREFGIRRIVPARELTLEEIRAFAAACRGARCELEVFVHGALCMCYSGQCQMSRLLGARKKSGGGGGPLGAGSARSGNRGLCAQPCRLPYTDDQGRTGYFLSPKDLCLLEELPALCQAGVDSLKIEGRLKSLEYVAVVTGIYRKYLDQYAHAGAVNVTEEDKAALTQIYSRGGFTTGYLYGNPGEKILSGQSPKNTGIYIGKVRSVVTAKSAGKDRAAAAGAAKKGAALVDVLLQGELSEGDGVEIRPAGRGGEIRQAGKDAGGVVTFRKELAGGILRIGDIKGKVGAGDRAFRVTRRVQLEQARQTFSGEKAEDLDRQMKRRISLMMELY